MWISRLRTVALPVLFLAAAGVGGWLTSQTWADDQAPGEKRGAAKPPIQLPKDTAEVVLAMKVTGGMIRNASDDPYLQIKADGSVVVTNRTNGAKKASKLTPAQLQDLLRFVVQENDFFNIDAEKIKGEIATGQGGGVLALMVSDGRTSAIIVNADSRKHEVSYYAADTYATQYPKAMSLMHFAAIERRLDEMAVSVQKGK